MDMKKFVERGGKKASILKALKKSLKDQGNDEGKPIT